MEICLNAWFSVHQHKTCLSYRLIFLSRGQVGLICYVIIQDPQLHCAVWKMPAIFTFCLSLLGRSLLWCARRKASPQGQFDAKARTVISGEGIEWPQRQMTLSVCPQRSVSGHNDHLLLEWLWMSDVRHAPAIIKLLLSDDHSWHK